MILVIEAVLFDLDGTLLQMDKGEFTTEYLRALSRRIAPVVDPGRFARALMASTGVMTADSNPAMTNAEVFWADFRSRLDDCIEKLEPILEDFYQNDFKKLSGVARPCAFARPSVQAAVDRGLRIALATNPVFPAQAVLDRLAWAGVEDMPWELVTSYEDMHFCKPNPGYYLEIARRMGLPPERCVMAGNDPGEDLAAAGAGMRTYLVTDFIHGSGQSEFSPDWAGSLADLRDWLAGSDLA